MTAATAVAPGPRQITEQDGPASVHDELRIYVCIGAMVRRQSAAAAWINEQVRRLHCAGTIMDGRDAVASWPARQRYCRCGAHLDTLLYWAQVLRIPAWMLWFDLPGQTRQGASSLRGESDHGRENAVDGISTHVRPSQGNIAALLAAPPEETIAYLQEQWHLLVRAGNLFGPAYVLRLIHEKIELIESILHDTRDDVRSSLLSLGAQYAESAAWLHEDADDQLVTLCTSRALEWAHAGNDHRLVAWALFRRSQQVAHEGNAAWSIGLAQAAGNASTRLPDQMRAAFMQQEAYGLALGKDEAACQRVAGRA